MTCEELIDLFTQLNNFSERNSDVYLSADAYRDVLDYLKLIFKFEINQNERDTYYEYSFLNHKNKVPELTSLHKKVLEGFMQMTLIK
jgi:hypothetical protein